MSAVTPSETDGAAALRGMLSALVRLALAPGTEQEAGWRAEAIAAQRRWAEARGDVGGTRLDSLWSAAVAAAERDTAVRRGETVNPTLPTMSPLRLDQLGAEPFDLEGAVQTIREAASFG